MREGRSIGGRCVARVADKSAAAGEAVEALARGGGEVDLMGKGRGHGGDVAGVVIGERGVEGVLERLDIV